MTREELLRIIASVKDIFERGEVLGCAFFAEPSFDKGVSLGSDGMTAGIVGLAVYRIIQASGHSVEMVCPAVIMLARSEESRN